LHLQGYAIPAHQAEEVGDKMVAVPQELTQQRQAEVVVHAEQQLRPMLRGPQPARQVDALEPEVTVVTTLTMAVVAVAAVGTEEVPEDLIGRQGAVVDLPTWEQ